MEGSDKRTSSIINSSMTCVFGLRLYNCKYSALFNLYFGASARNSECGPLYSVMGRFGWVAARDGVLVVDGGSRYAMPSFMLVLSML